jgi:hypothetical protein
MTKGGSKKRRHPTETVPPPVPVPTPTQQENDEAVLRNKVEHAEANQRALAAEAEWRRKRKSEDQ